MLTFAAPKMAVLLLLVPAAGVLLWWGARTRRRRLAAWAHADSLLRLARGVVPWRRTVRGGLLLLGIAACALALLRPRWGFHYEEVRRRGIDLMLIVDVSESMLAEDVSPSRLERAKREISDFLEIVEGDRVGLVAAAGTSFVQCPLTLDYGALREFLTVVDTDLIPTPGTDLGAALRTAAGAMDTSGYTRGKALVLISDGGNLADDPQQVATELQEQERITIYTVGIGDPEQAVPIRSADGSLKEFEGRVVTTRLEEETLKSIAHAGNGVYVRAVTGDLDLEKIYADIRERHTAAELGHAQRKVYHERFVWPLGFGLLCLVLEACMSERGRTPAAAALSLLLLGVPTAARADVSGDVTRGLRHYEQEEYAEALEAFSRAQESAPADPRTLFNRAGAEYHTGDYPSALEHFEAAATQAGDPGLRARSVYNAGNTYAQLSQFDEALAAYERALRIDPHDQDAKANLELVRRIIRQREQEQQEREDQQQQQEHEQEPEDQKPQQESPPGSDAMSEENQSQQSPDEQPQDRPAQPEDSDPPDGDPGQSEQPQDQPQASEPPGDGAPPETTPQPGAGDPQSSPPAPGEPAEGSAPEDAPVDGQMTRAEADRWLQQLPAEDVEALKDFWRRQQPRPAGPPKRDW